MTNPTPHGQVPDSIRVPLDSLHADAEYLLARLLAGTLTREQVVGVIRDRIDAARLEIDGLRTRVQELGAMLRENRSKRIVALETENLGLLHALAAEQDANTDLRQQLEAIGAGGVEPLRKRPRQIEHDHFRDATKMVTAQSAPAAAPAPQPAPAPLSEREAFEAWIEKDGGDLGTFGTPPNMHYRNSSVNNAWVAWKARAAIAAQGGRDAS